MEGEGGRKRKMPNEKSKPAVDSETRKTWVHINSWQYSRRIEIGPTTVTLQVTRETCSHCGTCQSRVEAFERALAQKPEVKREWIWKNNSTWLVFPKPQGTDLLEYLRAVLNLSSIRYS
jgi:hypothetical protein